MRPSISTPLKAEGPALPAKVGQAVISTALSAACACGSDKLTHVLWLPLFVKAALVVRDNSFSGHACL